MQKPKKRAGAPRFAEGCCSEEDVMNKQSHGSGKSLKASMLKWTLSGSAFAAVVMTTGGCADFDASAFNLMGRRHETTEPQKTVRLAQNDVDQQDAPADASAEAPTIAVANGAAVKPVLDTFDRAPRPAAPPQINIFGEFNGKARGPMKNVGEANFQQHTFLDEGYDADVAIDPSGKYILFASTRHSEHPDLYLQKVDGNAITQLTTDSADDANPVFSPDGQTIAFCSTRSGDWDIYTMDRDGRNVVQVTSGPMQDLHPTFSPDGTRLSYCSAGGRSGQWEIWTVDLRTLQRTMIAFGLFPSWSPDKSVDRIAFQRARQRGGRWFSLWTCDLVDGEARNVTEVAASTNAAIVSPSWSPDGKRLAFSTVTEPARYENGQALGQQDVWVVNADGTNRQRLTDGTGMNLTPFWGADNRVFFVSDRGGAEAIWSVRATSAAPAIARTEHNNATPAEHGHAEEHAAIAPAKPAMNESHEAVKSEISETARRDAVDHADHSNSEAAVDTHEVTH